MTITRFVPALRMRASIDCRAPSPMAIIMITAPTPMMMPSAVRPERSAFLRSASSAVARIVLSEIRRGWSSCMPHAFTFHR